MQSDSDRYCHAGDYLCDSFRRVIRYQAALARLLRIAWDSIMRLTVILDSHTGQYTSLQWNGQQQCLSCMP